jgi:hypothetical protein
MSNAAKIPSPLITIKDESWIAWENSCVDFKDSEKGVFGEW